MTTTGKLGFRILDAPPRVSADLISRIGQHAPSNLADAMGRFGFMDPVIVSRTGRPLAGPAVTVLLRPADNLMLHKAIDLAAPGDVLVATTCGNVTSAAFGELMCRAAKAKGLGGLVIDGAVRDVQAMTELGFPVFSRSVCPGGCDKDGPGEINVPISCGGTVVAPGDIVVGDADGIAVVPAAHADEVLRLVAPLAERETKRVAEIDRGVIVKPDIDNTLRARGVIE